MAKPKAKKPSAPTPAVKTTDFDRAVSALFQVPKDAVTDAELARPKRVRKKKD